MMIMKATTTVTLLVMIRDATFLEISDRKKELQEKWNSVSRKKKKIVDQKGGKRFGKKENWMYQNSIIKNQNGNLFHTLVFIHIF